MSSDRGYRHPRTAVIDTRAPRLYTPAVRGRRHPRLTAGVFTRARRENRRERFESAATRVRARWLSARSTPVVDIKPVSYSEATIAELERQLANALKRMDEHGYPPAPQHIPLPPPNTGPTDKDTDDGDLARQ